MMPKKERGGQAFQGGATRETKRIKQQQQQLQSIKGTVQASKIVL